MIPAPNTAAGGAGPGPRPRERFTAAQRVRRPADFDAARRQGRRIETGPFTVRLRMRGEGPARLGVIASRRAGPAVRRNYAKRVLRELFRRHPEQVPAGCDVVVTVRSSFGDFSFAEVRTKFLYALRQAPRKNI